MLVSDFLSQVRYRISDKTQAGYENEELYRYLNDGIAWLSDKLMVKGDSEMIQQIVVTSTAYVTIPSDFLEFAGKFPVKTVNGGTQWCNIDPRDDTITVEYFYKKPDIVDISSTIPFKDRFIPLLLMYVSCLALNRNEFDLTQDVALMTDHMKSLGLGSG